jgi:hypothetical protein
LNYENLSSRQIGSCIVTADEFRKWIVHLVLATLVVSAVVLGFPDWPMWAFIVVGVVTAIVFPIVPSHTEKGIES